MNTALQAVAVGKLSTRETLIREIQERVRAELVSQSGRPWRDNLNGPLGEQIAIASGSCSLDFTFPEHVAEGICTWLEQTFLNQPPQGFGPRRGDADTSPGSQGVALVAPNSGTGEAREAGPDHCPFCGQDIPAKAVA